MELAESGKTCGCIDACSRITQAPSGLLGSVYGRTLGSILDPETAIIQELAKLLIIAQKDEVEIRRRDGTRFSLISKKKKATTLDILNAVRDSRKS